MNTIVKTILGFAVAAVIAAGGYFTGEYTSDEAIAVGTSAEKASVACKSLLEGQGFDVAQPDAPPAD